jgi:hypothetical protein
MSSSLAQRLSAARHSRFVGRADELKLFESAILPQRRDSTLLFENGSAEQGKGSPPKQANAKQDDSTEPVYTDLRASPNSSNLYRRP